jgi:hypothetical protein
MYDVQIRVFIYKLNVTRYIPTNNRKTRKNKRAKTADEKQN